jgi:hypothetical protein
MAILMGEDTIAGVGSSHVMRDIGKKRRILGV